MRIKIIGVIKAITPIVSILVIWRLVHYGMTLGTDGVMFCGGIAAVAGLGGYEIREWLTSRQTTTPPVSEDDDKTAGS